MDQLEILSRFNPPIVETLEDYTQEYKDKDGNTLIGTTRIAGRLDKFLDKWANDFGIKGMSSRAYAINSANVGIVAHKMILHFNLGIEYSRPFAWEQNKEILLYEEIANICFLKYLDFLEDYPELEILHSERQLISNFFGFGGTIDIIALYKGRTILLDIKTTSGFYPSHSLQVAGGYKILCEENNINIDDIILLGLGKDPEKKYQMKILQPADRWDLRFLYLLADYMAEREQVDLHKTKEYKEKKKLDKEFYKVVK